MKSLIVMARSRLPENYLTIFNAFLLVCIVAGLAIKYEISQRLVLDSDNVVPGILSREIWIHQNFLTGFYASSADPNYFTCLFPFHFVPQILTNFSPLALKSASFVIFCCVILVFSILVFKLTKNVTCSLVFAALFSNLTPVTYALYDNPYGHTSTIFFIGVLSLLLYEFPYVKKQNFIISLILIAVITFSDSLFVIWLIIPGVAWYFLRYYHKKFPGFHFIILSSLVAGSVLLLKMKFLPVLQSATGDILVNDWYSMQTRFGFFIRGLIVSYNDAFLNFHFSYLTTGTFILGIMALLLLVCSVVMVYLKFRDPLQDSSTHLFTLLVFGYLVAFSIFFTFVLLLVSDPESIGRYTLFFGIVLFVIIALSYREEKIFSVILAGFLIAALLANYACLTAPNPPPNQTDYQLIEFLQSHNLTVGFAGYWDSNCLTYVSHESVEVRAVVFQGNEMTPFAWWSDARWYNVSSVHSYFILANDADNHLKTQEITPYLAVHPPNQILQYNSYTIYTFDGVPPLKKAYT